MKWYHVDLRNVAVLLLVAGLSLSVGAYTAGEFWAEEGCYTMFSIPVPMHDGKVSMKKSKGENCKFVKGIGKICVNTEVGVYEIYEFTPDLGIEKGGHDLDEECIQGAWDESSPSPYCEEGRF